jgi:hypothetical protein
MTPISRRPLLPHGSIPEQVSLITGKGDAFKTVFLDLDNELCLFQLMGKPCVLPFQFDVTTDRGIGLLCDRSSLLGDKALVNLTPP